MSETLRKALGLPDQHHPYHDQRSIDIAFEVFAYVGGNALGNEVINYGDRGELSSCTTHPQEPDLVRKLTDDVRCVTDACIYEQKAFPLCKHVYVEGNHEDRFRRYLRDKAPELWGITELHKLIGIDKQENWHWIPYDHKQKYNPLGTEIYIKHEPEGSSAKAALANAGVSHLYGHVHRNDMATKMRLDGQRIYAGSPGCMIDLEHKTFNYQKKNSQWGQGFHIIYLDESDGHYWIDTVEIKKGRAMYGGKVFKG